MSSKIKKIGIFIGSMLLIWLSGSYAGSIFSTRANSVLIPVADQYFDEKVEDVQFEAKDGVQIKAWYLSQNKRQKAVILMDGLRGNRLKMVERAKIYRQNGFAVLMPDLRGTGSSDPSLITFGWKERWDLLAAIDFLKTAGYQSIAVHGMSLGAATIVYSLQEKPDYDFVVLESCYDNIDQALANRVERFYLPDFLFQPLKFFTEWRTGVATNDLYPENFLHLCSAPTLIMAGDSEIRVRKSETELLYQRCGAKQKQIHFFKGAKHEDFMNRYDKEYRDLLQKWLLLQAKNTKSMQSIQ